MRYAELVSECQCQHIRGVHFSDRGHCARCKCTRFRRDNDRYPVGMQVVS